MPTPQRNAVADRTNEMDFGDAMRDVVRGCKVARREWGKGDYLFLQAGRVHIKIADDQPEYQLTKGIHQFVVGDGDVIAEDWIVVRD